MPRRGKKQARTTFSNSWRAKIEAHETFSHDSLDHLGYDWSRIGDPEGAPVRPLKIYAPETAEEVASVIRDANRLGEKLTVRSKGHSSNNLVLSDRGSVLLMQMMDGILEVDTDNLTATVEGGAIAAQIDDHLAQLGYGLPIVGDHKDITVGGFSSVGGISPGSHRYGMFVDNVVSIEYVTWDGEIRHVNRTDGLPELRRVLGGLGKWGVIVKMTVRIRAVDKYGTILRNHIKRYRSIDDFIEGSTALLENPPEDSVLMRGVWADLRKPSGKRIRLGTFSVYRDTPQTGWKRMRNRISYGLLHGLGYWAGRLPKKLDLIVKQIGTLRGALFTPKFGSIKYVETFADRILEATVGEPWRSFILLPKVDEGYRDLFREAHDFMIDVRERHDCFTYIAIYLKGIDSPYLARDEPGRRYVEFLFVVGQTEKMNDEILEEVAAGLDDICIRHGGLRYMHTRTSKDPLRFRLVNPNTYWAEQYEAAGPAPAAVPVQTGA